VLERLAGSTPGLVKQGTKLHGSSPELKTLTDTVRGRLLEAGKAAAMTVAKQPDRCVQRPAPGTARSLSGLCMPGQGANEKAEERRSDRVEADDEEEGYEEGPVDEEPAEGEREERPRRRPDCSRASGRTRSTVVGGDRTRRRR
jgi:hypothetical protein